LLFTEKPKKIDIEIVEFHPNHVEVMEVRSIEALGIMQMEDAHDRLEQLSKNSLDAQTFLHDGRVIFCAGYVQLWPGVIEVWMIPSIYVKTITLSFCKLLKAYVNDIMEKHNCHRLQTTAPNDAEHDKWMKFLGFEKEGVLRKYTYSYEDYSMHAKVIK